MVRDPLKTSILSNNHNWDPQNSSQSVKKSHIASESHTNIFFVISPLYNVKPISVSTLEVPTPALQPQSDAMVF